jgi:hypothetical protein
VIITSSITPLALGLNPILDHCQRHVPVVVNQHGGFDRASHVSLLAIDSVLAPRIARAPPVRRHAIVAMVRTSGVVSVLEPVP